MRKRDLGILLIAAFAVFVSLQHESNFGFREAWYHVHHDDTENGDNWSMDTSDTSPLPLVVDLNGDGKTEVVFTTRSGAIQIVEPVIPAAGESFASARLRHKLKIHQKPISVGPGDRFAVAIAAGHLDPPPSLSPRALTASNSPSSSSSSRASRERRRRSSLAVVTDDWSVLLYDHNLKLVWETHIPEMNRALPAREKEVAVLVSNYTMRRGDRGVVIVGGSVEADPEEVGGSWGMEEEEERREESHRRSAKEGEELEDVTGGAGGAKDRHFSYFAFDGATGALRWKHTSKDFHRDLLTASQQLLPQHNYKLDATALESRHFGELECRDYRDAILRWALPHAWSHRADTALELASFHRHRRRSHKRHMRRKGTGGHHHGHGATAVGALAPGGHGHHHDGGHHGPPERDLAGRDHEGNVVAGVLGKTLELAASGKRRLQAANHGKHAAHGGQAVHGNYSSHHWWAANAVVAHVREGIEVIHLYSGRTICKLLLPPDALHADVNGDSVVDHVHASGARRVERHELQLEEGPVTVRSCWAVATSGIPPREELFNGSVCRPETRGLDLPSGLMAGAEHLYWGAGHSGNLDPVQVAPPVVLPHPRDWRRGRRLQAPPQGRQKRRHQHHHQQHGHAHQRKHHQQQHPHHGVRGGDVIFLNSKGEVTSYATEGIHGGFQWGGHTHGHQRWQVKTEADWTVISDFTQPHQMRRTWTQGHVVPTLLALPLVVGGPPEVILAVGEMTAVVLSPGGVELTRFSVPVPAVKPVVVADMNGDGLNDLILVTAIGVYGFTQVRHPGALLLSSLAACVVIVLVVAFLTLHLGVGGSAASRRRAMGQRKRSTD